MTNVEERFEACRSELKKIGEDFFKATGKTYLLTVFDKSGDYETQGYLTCELDDLYTQAINMVCDSYEKTPERDFRRFLEKTSHHITEICKEIDEKHPPLDVGFRVLKVDEPNVEDNYYAPTETDQQMLFDMNDSIKSDRTDLDLLFGCALDFGLTLDQKYKQEQIDGFTVYIYGDTAFVGCFGKNVSDTVIKTIAERKPPKVIFRDDGFADSSAKIKAETLINMISPDTKIMNI